MFEFIKKPLIMVTHNGSQPSTVRNTQGSLFKIHILRPHAILNSCGVGLGNDGKCWGVFSVGGLYQRDGLSCFLQDGYNWNVWRVKESQSWLTQGVCLVGFVEMVRAKFWVLGWESHFESGWNG